MDSTPENMTVPVDVNDTTFATLSNYANDALLYGQTPNKPASSIGMAGEDQTQVSPYPWIRYGYNDSQPYERRYMWTPEKWLTVANSEAERPLVYNAWLASVTPHHDVTGRVELLDAKGNVLNHYNNALLVDSVVGARVVLKNNQPGDPIARINYKVELCRFNPSTESLEVMYTASDDHVEFVLLPGEEKPYKIVRQIPLMPGRWKGYVYVYNSDDGILLCSLTIEASVAIDHGGGIISFG
jgi:hypothetical protein